MEWQSGSGRAMQCGAVEREQKSEYSAERKCGAAKSMPFGGVDW